MNDAEEKLHRAVALFRYGLIADLIHLPSGTPVRSLFCTAAIRYGKEKRPRRARPR